MRRLLSLLAVVCLGLAALPAMAQTGELPGDCVLDESATVRILLLIDQSGSLQRTDPDDQRITGARAVVQSYASLADRVEQVEIQIAGFGETYQDDSWTPLDQNTLDSVLDRVDEVGSVSDQDHTDYVYALDGAADAFASGGATCQILFWFTDGEHDLDSALLPAEGLQRFYFSQPVTPANVDEAEALMPGLVCDTGGLAERLGDGGVSPQIMLLGDESGMDDASRRVLQGMGGDPSLDCGPGNGSFQSADDASRLPFLMACASQVGAHELVDLSPEAGGRVLVTEQTVDTVVPYQLATEIVLITRGSSPTLASSTLADTAERGDGSGTTAVVATPVGASFSVEMSGVVEVCGFVSAVAASPVVQSISPTLYQGEPGEFVVVAEGPHGRIDGDALGRFQLTADRGEVGAHDGTGWPIAVAVLPIEPGFELLVELSSDPGLTASTTQAFTLNEQINAPAIVAQPPPISGEGTGPFQVQLQIDPRDGGELCLLSTTSEMSDAGGEPITVTASLEGSECIQLDAGETTAAMMEITLDRGGFAHDVLEFQTRAVPSTRPDRSEEGALALDLEVTPRANPALVAIIVAGLMLVMLGLIWAILYGVNRLIGRIPDPRRNRIRYANFVAELAPNDHGDLLVGLAEMPVDSEFRIPRRTPGRLDAGRLVMERIVSVAPWMAPYARIGMGTDLVATHQGPGFPGRTVVTEQSYRGRARDALGPLVALGITGAQVQHLAEGTTQKVPGVLLFDIRASRGADASRFAADMVDASLEVIAAEISAKHLVDPMERTEET